MSLRGIYNCRQAASSETKIKVGYNFKKREAKIVIINKDEEKSFILNITQSSQSLIPRGQVFRNSYSVDRGPYIETETNTLTSFSTQAFAQILVNERHYVLVFETSVDNKIFQLSFMNGAEKIKLMNN